MFLLLVLFIDRRRRRAGAPAPLSPGFGPAGESTVHLLFMAVTLALLSPTSPWPFYRYLAPLLPVVCLLLTRPIAAAMKVHVLAGPGLFVLLALSGPLPDFLYELTHEYHGPVEGMVRYLQQKGRPGETVAVNYEDLPLAFYTDLRVVGGLTGADLVPAYTAEWIIIRQNTIGEVDGAVAEDLRHHIAWQDYRRIELDVPDTLFDNREAVPDSIIDGPRDAGHPFRTAASAPHLVIFRRIH
jgi:hypothetical protein